MLFGYEVCIDVVLGVWVGMIKLCGDSVVVKVYVGGKKLDVFDEEGFCDIYDLGFFVDDEIVIFGW